mgnify:FL=1
MENNITNNTTKEVRGTAVSAYLMFILSWLYLFNKTNKNVNNEFVKWHVKSSIIIFFWFMTTYLVFITNSLFSNIKIFNLWLNIILASTFCTWLLLLIAIWIYKAHRWEELNIKNSIKISKNKEYIDIDWDWEITEKEKITIILSFIPFIGFLNYAKYRNHLTIKYSTRLNISISLFICLLYIYSYNNLANIFSLIYSIFVVYVWINLFWSNLLVQIKLNKFFSPRKLYTLIITIKNYLKNYFSDENIKSFWELINQEEIKQKKEANTLDKELNSKKDIKLPKILIYIPIINLIFLFFRSTKYSIHIINGIFITLLLVISWILSKYWYINSHLYILFLFPILFWIWYSRYSLAYKIPIIFDIYIWLSKIFSFLKFWTKTINTKRKEVNEINIKVK